VPGNVHRSVALLSDQVYPTVLGNYVMAIDQVSAQASQAAEGLPDTAALQARIRSLQGALHERATRLDTCYDAILGGNNILQTCEEMVAALRLAIQEAEQLQAVAVQCGVAHGLPQADLKQLQERRAPVPVCAMPQQA
jgi:GTP cyclohydrolase III